MFLPYAVAWVPEVVTISASDLKLKCRWCGNTCFCLKLLLECQQLWQYLLLTWSLSDSNVAIPISALNYCLSASRQQLWQYLLLTWSLSARNVAISVSALNCCLSASSCDNLCFWPEAWVPAMWQYPFLPWTIDWVPAVVTISAFWPEAWVPAMWQYLFLPWTVAWVPAVVTISASELKLECQQCGNTCFWLELLLDCFWPEAWVSAMWQNTCFCLELLLECEELLDSGLHVTLGSLRALQLPHFVPLAEANTMKPST